MCKTKIHTVNELSEVCEKLRKQGKKIAHCHGAFDLLHPGHIRHLQSAKEMADVLVVTLTEDQFIQKGPGRPVYNQQLRAETLASIAAVDHVATSPWPTAVETINKIRPDFYVKGQDYRDRKNDLTGAIIEEENAVQTGGGQLVFTDEVQFSSTRLLNEFFSVFTDEQREYLQAFKKKFSLNDVITRLDTLKQTRVLVVGEAIIDEYHYCIPDSMSNKSPTLSARFESAEIFAGGVVAVGHHLAGLSKDVHLLAGSGVNSEDDGVTHHLRHGVTATVIKRPDAPAVRKRRFVHRFLNQKLFEVTFLEDRPLLPETQREMLAAIEELAPQADVVIALDFGHGFFTQPVVEKLREKSKFLAVNAQINSSNRGFNSIRKYKGADYISVDEYEIRLPYGDRYGSLESLIDQLNCETGCLRINVTLGNNGTIYFDESGFHRAPVFTSNVVDTMGAGDAFLAVTSLLVHSGAPAELVPFIGNCMGGLMTQIIGHRTPVDAVSLYKFITTLLK